MNILFVPHGTAGTELETWSALREALPDGSIRSVVDIAPELYETTNPRNAATLSGVYQRVGAVIGQHIHSVLLPFGVGTPAVSVFGNEPTRWIQEALDNSDLHVSPWETCRSDQLVALVRRLVDERMERQGRCFVRRAALQEQANHQSREVLKSSFARSPQTALRIELGVPSGL